MKILVTGAAGFIGFHLCQRLLERGEEVIGLDNLNSYYDVSLKQARLDQLVKYRSFQFHRLDLADREGMEKVFAEAKPRRVVHLGAQAGVRHSLTDPHIYIASNITGFLHVLEGCRLQKVDHLVYASSSSVYGANTTMPFSVHQVVDHPLSLYAATKKANELMAHSYAHLHHFPVTGLRFFTVYGPWGRPDMALFLFTKAILEGRPIDLFNSGRMKRDFTYIADIVEGLVRTLDKPATPNSEWSSDNPDPATSSAPYQLYNIGNSEPIELIEFVAAIEAATGKTAVINPKPLQPGDVLSTFAEVDSLETAIGFRPATGIREGVKKFVDWYRSYYNV